MTRFIAMAIGIACSALATGATAGPADRMLRACAPGVGADPAATLIAEGWLELGAAHAALIEGRIGLLVDAAKAADVRFPLDTLRNEDGKREERGRETIARTAEDTQTTYLTPGDGSTMVQISLTETPPLLYCMVSTVYNREAAEIAQRLTQLTEPRMVEGYGGITSIKSLRDPTADPITDVSATPLPAQWRVLTIDLGLNGELADADLFIEAFWNNLQ